MRNQSGYTMVEVVAALALSIVITGLIAARIPAIIRQSDLDSAIADAAAIAQSAEIASYRVTASAVDPTTHIYAYTYGFRRTSYEPVTTLNTELGGRLRVQSPFDTPYEYLANGSFAAVRFTVPNPTDDLVGYPSTVSTAPGPGGSTVVTYQTLGNPLGRRSRVMAAHKRDVYLESTR